MLWDSHERREWAGQHYGMKAEQMEEHFHLPSRCGQRFELALGGMNVPTDRLLAAGWKLRSALEVTRDPWTYQAYIRGSKAEFSVAKHGFVVSSHGGLSERSTSYLASGRPVVIQDTGFSRHLPTGEGLLPFSTHEEAVEAIRQVDANYARHCHAARELIEVHFDARRVLAAMLEDAISAASRSRSAPL
jgi:hypothetical protein